MSRRHLAPLVLAVTLLLALVAIAARGRPLGSGGGRGGGLPLSFWDYTYTTIVIVVVTVLIALGVAAALVRGDPSQRSTFFQRHLFVSLAVLTVIATAGVLLSRHIDLSRLRVHRLEPAQNGSGNLGQNERHPAAAHALHFRWQELVVVLGLLLLVAGVLAATRSRRIPKTPTEIAPEAIVAAFDQSLDDLRTDPDLRRAIVAAYARMETALAVAGIPRRPAEAPLEYVERALLTLDASAEAVRRLTDLFEWARFSHHEPEPAMRDEAVDALIAVRDELRASELIPA
jgi:hypothetical protein